MAAFGKIAGAAAAAMMAVMAAGASAQDYPTREIKLVVPTAPGGVVDATARVIQPALAEVLGRPVIVENLPGAGNTVGVGQVSRSEPDGYTIALAVNAPIVMAPFLYARLPYDPVKDLQPIGIFGETYIALVVRSDSPFQSLEDIIAAAKDRPEELTFGSAGIGSAHQVAGELLNKYAEIEITHIPFQGGGPAMESLLGGHIDMSYATLAAAQPHVNSGNMRIIGVVESDAASGHGDLPRLNQAVEGVGISTTWLSLFAPRGLPDVAATRLAEALAAAIARDDVVANLRKIGVEPELRSAAETAEIVEGDLEFWREAVAIAGIEPQ